MTRDDPFSLLGFPSSPPRSKCLQPIFSRNDQGVVEMRPVRDTIWLVQRAEFLFDGIFRLTEEAYPDAIHLPPKLPPSRLLYRVAMRQFGSKSIVDLLWHDLHQSLRHLHSHSIFVPPCVRVLEENMNDSHGWTAIRLVAWAFCRALVSIVLGHRYFVIGEDDESGERVHRIAYCLPESMERDDIDGTILPIVTALLSSASKEHELPRFQTILGEWENRYDHTVAGLETYEFLYLLLSLSWTEADMNVPLLMSVVRELRPHRMLEKLDFKGNDYEQSEFDLLPFRQRDHLFELNQHFPSQLRKEEEDELQRDGTAYCDENDSCSFSNYSEQDVVDANPSQWSTPVEAVEDEDEHFQFVPHPLFCFRRSEHLEEHVPLNEHRDDSLSDDSYNVESDTDGESTCNHEDFKVDIQTLAFNDGVTGQNMISERSITGPSVPSHSASAFSPDYEDFRRLLKEEHQLEMELVKGVENDTLETRKLLDRARKLLSSPPVIERIHRASEQYPGRGLSSIVQTTPEHAFDEFRSSFEVHSGGSVGSMKSPQMHSTSPQSAPFGSAVLADIPDSISPRNPGKWNSLLKRLDSVDRTLSETERRVFFHGVQLSLSTEYQSFQRMESDVHSSNRHDNCDSGQMSPEESFVNSKKIHTQQHWKSDDAIVENTIHNVENSTLERSSSFPLSPDEPTESDSRELIDECLDEDDISYRSILEQFSRIQLSSLEKRDQLNSHEILYTPQGPENLSEPLTKQSSMTDETSIPVSSQNGVPNIYVYVVQSSSASSDCIERPSHPLSPELGEEDAFEWVYEENGESEEEYSSSESAPSSEADEPTAEDLLAILEDARWKAEIAALVTEARAEFELEQDRERFLQRYHDRALAPDVDSPKVPIQTRVPPPSNRSRYPDSGRRERAADHFPTFSQSDEAMSQSRSSALSLRRSRVGGRRPTIAVFSREAARSFSEFEFDSTDPSTPTLSSAQLHSIDKIIAMDETHELTQQLSSMSSTSTTHETGLVREETLEALQVNEHGSMSQDEEVEILEPLSAQTVDAESDIVVFEQPSEPAELPRHLLQRHIRSTSVFIPSRDRSVL